MRLWPLGVLGLVLALPCFADFLATDFSNPSIVGAGTTAVYDLASQSIHVPFVVDRNCGLGATTCNAPAQENDPVNQGDGSDGAFGPSTLYQLDTGHGSTAGLVTFDTSREYQFTQFTLPTGITIAGSGSNPLVIRVQGTMEVDGTIDASGGNGASATAAGSGVAPAGGTAGCAGKAGGAGGTINGSGGGNMDAGTGGLGGTSANSPQTAGGGGGGGSLDAGGHIGPAGTGGAGGTAGAQISNATFQSYILPTPATWTSTPLYAGSGGGGGGAELLGTPFYGAGGGGGGGSLLIEVGGDLTVKGTITANGGNGGAAAGGAGCGGGGSGGTVAIFTGGHFYSTGGGTLEALGGAGCGSAPNDGLGQQGVLRWATTDGDIAAGNNFNQNPPPDTNPLGQTYYSTQPYDFYTNPIDTNATNAPYLGATIDDTANGGTLTYQFAGSNDNFQSDNTGWVSQSQISQLSGKRYFKVHVTMQASSRTASPVIRSIAMQVQLPEFDYRFAGCARIHSPHGGAGRWMALLFLIYLLILPKALRRRETTTATGPH